MKPWHGDMRPSVDNRWTTKPTVDWSISFQRTKTSCLEMATLSPRLTWCAVAKCFSVSCIFVTLPSVKNRIGSVLEEEANQDRLSESTSCQRTESRPARFSTLLVYAVALHARGFLLLLWGEASAWGLLITWTVACGYLLCSATSNVILATCWKRKSLTVLLEVPL